MLSLQQYIDGIMRNIDQSKNYEVKISGRIRAVTFDVGIIANGRGVFVEQSSANRIRFTVDTPLAETGDPLPASIATGLLRGSKPGYVGNLDGVVVLPDSEEPVEERTL